MGEYSEAFVAFDVAKMKHAVAIAEGDRAGEVRLALSHERQTGYRGRMQPVSYAHHHFPPEAIRHAVWLYLRFTLSYRDVEELLAERGLELSYETVRRWVLKFGPAFARNLRRLRPRPSDSWHLDEMVVSIGKHSLRAAVTLD